MARLCNTSGLHPSPFAFSAQEFRPKDGISGHFLTIHLVGALVKLRTGSPLVVSTHVGGTIQILGKLFTHLWG